MTTPTPEAARELLAEIDAMPPYHPDLLGGRMVLLGRRCRPILAAYAEQADKLRLATAECEAARQRFDAAKRAGFNGHDVGNAIGLSEAKYDAARAANTSEIPNSSTPKEPT